MFALLIATVLAGPPLRVGPAALVSRAQDACGLLDAREIRAVQGAVLEQRKSSAHERRGLHFAQCVFALSDFSRSISLTVISASAGNEGSNRVRTYWTDTFQDESERAPAPSERSIARVEGAPRRIPGAGDEAFWTGDARAGALYVLRGDLILRISVGGVRDESERIRRSKALAEAALKRLSRQ